MIGRTIGSYEVLAKLGEGGMGEVYHARDTRLGRDVALKLLPDAFAQDRDRLARFEREARTLASLNHPNIAALYGIEQPADGQPGLRALAMELVPGRTLQEVIASGLEMADLVAIAKSIADALEAAHEQGVIHRDLKPSNVKIRDDGTVKLLDFGLAKALDPNTPSSAGGVADSPTMTSPAMTMQGFIIGTAAYMAPEQAKGRPVDRRADIWAFGVVLYEMLTRRRLFEAETVSETLAAVLKQDVDLSQLPETTPIELRRLLTRCLERDPRLRLRDIGEARVALSQPMTAPPVSLSEATAGAKTAQRSGWLAGAGWLTAGLVIGAALWALASGSRQTSGPVEWNAVRLVGPEWARAPRVSPDGELLAFETMVNGNSQVGVMKTSTGHWTVRTHDRSYGLAEGIAWSPDSSRVYFHRLTDAPTGIFSVPALGGEERLILENACCVEPLADGSLFLMRINTAREQQLHRFWPGTGKLEPLPFVSANRGLTTRSIWRYGDTRVLFTGRPIDKPASDAGLYSFNLDGSEIQRHRLNHAIENVLSVSVKPDDRALFVTVRDSGIFRVLRLREGGEPESTMTLLSAAAVDVDRHGALYASLSESPGEFLRFRENAPGVEMVMTTPAIRDAAISLSDGRVLVASPGATSRVTIVSTGKEPVPLVDTDEPTMGPMTTVGANRTALRIGTTPDIAVVATDTGRLVSRFKAPANIETLGASPDGSMLYYSSAGSIFAIPLGGGNARRIGAGDSFAVDPDSGDLIVRLNELERFRLVRLSPAGGAPVPIEIRSAFRLVDPPIAAGAIRNGRMLLPIASAASWYWFLGVLDLRSGRLDKVSVDYFTDFHFATWTSDGRILGSSVGARSALWKFTPVQASGRAR